MAAIPVLIVGTITTKSPKEGGEVSGSGVEQCVIHGLASIEGLGVGGGPVYPPAGGEKPPQGPPGQPAFPIWGGPGAGFPDKPGYPPVVGGGPIIPPDAPEKPPDGVPPIDWKVVWTPSEGWIVVGIPNVPHPAPAS